MALRPREPTTPVGRSLELGLEIALAVVLGMALGYYADRWLGTEPIFLIVFLFLGFATAIRIIYRFAAPKSTDRTGVADRGSEEQGD